MAKLRKRTEERLSESRMRQIRKSGLMRGTSAFDGLVTVILWLPSLLYPPVRARDKWCSTNLGMLT